MSKPKKKPCGAHVELVSSPAARVTRCACGTVHVHLHTHGISMRLDADALRNVSNALTAAVRVIDLAEAPPVKTPRDETIN